MLHELYLLDGSSAERFRLFRIVVGLVVGLVWLLFGAVVGGLAVMVTDTFLFRIDATVQDGFSEVRGAMLVGALVFGVVGATLAGIGISPRPSVRTQLDWHERLRYAVGVRRLAGDLGIGSVVGLVVGLIAGRSAELIDALVNGVNIGLAVGFVVGLVVATGAFVQDLLEPEVVSADPPRRFAHAGPDAVLTASRVNGLVGGLVVWWVSSLIGALGAAPVFRHLWYWAQWVPPEATGRLIGIYLLVWLLGGFVAGLLAAIRRGVDAWSYNRWLRWRLGAQDTLPARLRVLS